MQNLPIHKYLEPFSAWCLLYSETNNIYILIITDTRYIIYIYVLCTHCESIIITYFRKLIYIWTKKLNGRNKFEYLAGELNNNNIFKYAKYYFF